MSKDLIAKCIGQSISNRTSLLTDFQKKLAQQETLDIEFKKNLLAEAPKSLLEWLTEECVLNSLFQYGRCGTKIVFHENYGFGDRTDVEHKMNLLAAAWKNIVTIQVSGSESHRADVHFTVIM